MTTDDKLEQEGVALLDREAERLHDVVRWKHERLMARIVARKYDALAVLMISVTAFVLGIPAGALASLVVELKDVIGAAFFALFLFLICSVMVRSEMR